MPNDKNQDKDIKKQSSISASSGSTVSNIIASNPQPTMRPITEGFSLCDDNSLLTDRMNDGE